MPVFNHGETVHAIVARLRASGLHCVLVDDGSSPDCAKSLDDLARQYRSDAVTLLRHARNQGKGAAMMTGLQHAQSAGYTHALQIDADGQHDVQDLPAFLQASALHPDAVIAGNPVFDDSVPRVRLVGRYATHVWVWINTLSLSIRDSMCGFRIYPLAPTLEVIRRARPGRRMDFDTEILVRLHWRGLAVVNLPTRVIYPPGGRSHFRLFRDNVLISTMHARLFFGMLLRLPALLLRRLRP